MYYLLLYSEVDYYLLDSWYSQHPHHYCIVQRYNL